MEKEREEILRLRVALILDIHEFTVDFGSSILRIVIVWKVCIIIALTNEIALSTAILLGGTRIVDKGTNWFGRSRHACAVKWEEHHNHHEGE